jgi:hypothetical protein
VDLVPLVGGVAALLVAATLVAGAAGVARGSDRGRPWLLVLHGFHLGRPGASHEALRGVEPVDVLLLALAAVTYAGWWPGPGATHVWWMALAVAQPVLGIPILVVTRLAGRSGLMGGALVLSALMLVDDPTAGAGWLGAVAAVLLLVGDLATTERPRKRLAPVIAAGYAALVGWFGWVAVLLLT